MPKSFKAPIVALCTLISAALTLSPATAQTWPERNVTLILPLGPGSGVDIGARLLAEKLSAKWGKPVIVENRPGGDAIVAINAFIGAKDPHTLLMAPTSTFTAHPIVHMKVPYDVKELVPIARFTNTLVAVGVPASLNVNSLKELVDLARAQPGKLNSAGTTGAVDFVVSGFLSKAGVDITKVPYRDGVQALNDLAEGRIQLYVAALAIMRPQVEAGKVKIIGFTNRERAPTLPNVPTASEAGFPALQIDGLVGVFGPRNMTDDVRNKIAKDIIEAAADPEITKRLTLTGQLVRPGGADEFAKEIADQSSRVMEAAKAAGIAPKQ
jgi:tripartite-type tricarboxylate transporter receptor subunit TctC